MIIGIGTDIVDTRRIERLLTPQFIKRCFTSAEIKAANFKNDPIIRLNFFAKRYAVKEAVAKALGCGIGAQCGLKDIECLNDNKGAPTIILTGNALKTKNTRNDQARVDISLSDEGHYAIAFAVISV